MCISACVCVGVCEFAFVCFVAHQEIDGRAPTLGEVLTHSTLTKCRWLSDA